MKLKIRIKRVYDDYSKEDGFRVLVDRLWPRGVSKERAKIGLWLKSIAPSTELRQWFDHDPEKWAEFQKRYYAELKDLKEEVEALREHAKKQTVTLLFAAKDPKINHAAALENYLEGKA